MTLRYLSDVVMVGVVVLATVLALWGATKDPLIGIGFGVLLVQFYHLMEMRNTTRALIRLYNLLGGRDEPVSEDFRAVVQRFRQIVEELGSEEAAG